jgi:hypothetical protein
MILRLTTVTTAMVLALLMVALIAEVSTAEEPTRPFAIQAENKEPPREAMIYRVRYICVVPAYGNEQCGPYFWVHPGQRVRAYLHISYGGGVDFRVHNANTGKALGESDGIREGQTTGRLWINPSDYPRLVFVRVGALNFNRYAISGHYGVGY